MGALLAAAIGVASVATVVLIVVAVRLTPRPRLRLGDAGSIVVLYGGEWVVTDVSTALGQDARPSSVTAHLVPADEFRRQRRA